jgi:hypothetical protein
MFCMRNFRVLDRRTNEWLRRNFPLYKNDMLWANTVMRMGCKRRVDERQIRREEGKSCGNYAYHLTLFVSRTFLDLKGARLLARLERTKWCAFGAHSLTHTRTHADFVFAYNEMQAWHWWPFKHISFGYSDARAGAVSGRQRVSWRHSRRRA